MFDTLTQLIRNTKKLSVNRIAKVVFDQRDVQLDVAKANVEQMFNEGVDSRGNQIGEYSPTTIKIKISKGQRHDHMTLRDTREFHDSVKVRSEAKAIVINADTVKPGGVDLAKKHPYILGLTDESEQQIQREILPMVRRSVLENILVGI